jgi:hypothetical protein
VRKLKVERSTGYIGRRVLEAMVATTGTRGGPNETVKTGHERVACARPDARDHGVGAWRSGRIRLTGPT